MTEKTRPTYLERLAARSTATGTVLCLGVDPDPAILPPGFEPDVRGIERFANLLIEAALPYVAAVKPNLAFFEAFGNIYAAVYDDIIKRADGKKHEPLNTLYPNVFDGVDGMNFITQCVASSNEGGAWKSMKHAMVR